jgi:hypothetical protein
MLARDPARLSVHDIMEASRHLHSGKPVSRALAIPGVSHLVAKVDAARRASCADQTLLEMLQTSPLQRREPTGAETADLPDPGPADDPTRRLSSGRR